MALDYTNEWASESPWIVAGNAPTDAEVSLGHSIGPYDVNHQNWILNQLHQRVNILHRQAIQPYTAGQLYQNRQLVMGSDNVVYVSLKLNQFKDQDPTTDTNNDYWAPWLESQTPVGTIKTIAYDDGVTIDRLLRCGWEFLSGTNERVLAAGGTSDQDTTIGDNTYSFDINVDLELSMTGTHKHLGAVSAHALTEQQMPQHCHSFQDQRADARNSNESFSLVDNIYKDSDRNPLTIRIFTSTSGGGSAHTHPIIQTAAGDHTHTALRKISGSGSAQMDHIKVFTLFFTGLPTR